MNQMQIDWIEPSLELPPQGKKVLHFHSGDISVRQRFGDYWFPIPFIDSLYADCDAPTLWKDIGMPGTYTGFMHVLVQGVELSIDELEKIHPDEYSLFVDIQLAYFNKTLR